jgi:hypothetical protein
MFFLIFYITRFLHVYLYTYIIRLRHKIYYKWKKNLKKTRNFMEKSREKCTFVR